MTCMKLGNFRAVSLNFPNITLSRAIRQMLTQSFLDLEDARRELLSIYYIILDRRRSYVAITSSECRSKVLLSLIFVLKRNSRRIDNYKSRSEPSPVVSRYVFLYPVSKASKPALRSGK